MGATILYIEEHPMLLDLFASQFRSDGHVVYAYGSAEAAAHHLESTEAQVAIIDVGIPHRNGDNFAAELARRQPQVAILLVAGVPYLQHLKALIPKADILAKPTGLPEVLAFIHREGSRRFAEATVPAGHAGAVADGSDPGR